MYFVGILLALQLLSSSSFAFEYVADGIVRVPLEPMKTGMERLLEAGGSPKLLHQLSRMYQKKAQQWRTSHDGKPVPSNDTVPLWKIFDWQYYAKINIGKPARTFKMLMTMEWSYSWVISSQCPKSQVPCEFHQKYNHLESTSYVPDGKSFTLLEFEGFLSTDTFQVGQLKCSNQTFVELTKLPWIWSVYMADGILGLGFPNLSPHYVPFPVNFFRQNNLKPIFSVYMNRDIETSRGGSLFFGGINTKHNKSQFTTIPIISQYYWQFQLDKVQIVLNKKSRVDLCSNGCTAMADPSSNTIVVPDEEIDELNQHIGALKLFYNNRYLIACDIKGPKISFVLGNNEFHIKPQDYIQKFSFTGITICLSAFIAANNIYPNKTWALGGAFLYRYYTAYDYEGRKFMIADSA